jgi:hypothetical protein
MVVLPTHKIARQEPAHEAHMSVQEQHKSTLESEEHTTHLQHTTAAS